MAPYPEQESASGAAMPQYDLNNGDISPYDYSGALYAIDLPPETIADYVKDTDITNLCEVLEAPPIHPSAINTIESDDYALEERTPSSASRRSGCCTFTDEEIRQRRAERQKNYRQRQREAKAEVEKKIGVTAAEIEAELALQDALLVKSTAFTKAAEYCASTINVASFLVSNTIDKVRSDCKNAVENSIDWMAWFSLQVYTPSDPQLHAFLARKNLDELENMSLQLTKRTMGLVNRWNDEPEARENIEAQIERVKVMRLRSLRYFIEKRPEFVVQILSRRLMPALPDGAPNPKLVEAVAALELTPEQLESFEREWVLYLQQTESIRQEARSSLSFLASFQGNESAAAFCSIGAAGLFLDRLQAVQELETHPSSEANAISNLNLWLTTDLTMKQKGVLFKSCMPHYPDAIQIGRIVFGDNYGNAVSAAEVQSLPVSAS